LTGAEIEATLTAYYAGQKDAWSRTRWLATIVANFSGNAKKGGLQPTDLLRFDDEHRSSGIEKLFKIAKDG
jgi:hypothetical protein